MFSDHLLGCFSQGERSATHPPPPERPFMGGRDYPVAAMANQTVGPSGM